MKTMRKDEAISEGNHVSYSPVVPVTEVLEVETLTRGAHNFIGLQFFSDPPQHNEAPTPDSRVGPESRTGTATVTVMTVVNDAYEPLGGSADGVIDIAAPVTLSVDAPLQRVKVEPADVTGATHYALVLSSLDG